MFNRLITWRLESLNKKFNAGILISEATYDLVKSAFFCSPLGPFSVKGKNLACRVYALLSPLNSVGCNREIYTDIWNHMIELYIAGDFEQALLNVSTYLQYIPDDTPAIQFIASCREYRRNLPNTWDGIMYIHDK